MPNSSRSSRHHAKLLSSCKLSTKLIGEKKGEKRMHTLFDFFFFDKLSCLDSQVGGTIIGPCKPKAGLKISADRPLMIQRVNPLR